MVFKEAIFTIASTKTNCCRKVDIDGSNSNYISIRNYSRVIYSFLFFSV